MIEKILCESDLEENYNYLIEDRKDKYRQFYNDAVICPDKYVISVDVASPHSKDQSCVIKYNYEEYLKGNLVIESMEVF